MTDPRTLDERYSRAMRSSDLQPTPEQRVDVDYLIAAGLVKEGLGTMLYRLATEWDMASGDYRLARNHARAVEMQALQIQRNARKYPAEAETLLAEADRLLTQARAEAITAKALALVHLKTLRETTDALGRFACMQATRRKFMEPDAVVLGLASKSLNLWLDGTCSACSGRGFNGGFNGPKLMCTSCGSSGRAHWQLSKREPHAAFIRGLLAEMDRMASRVEDEMRRFLRQNG